VELLDLHPRGEDEVLSVDTEETLRSEEGEAGEEAEDQVIQHRRETTKERSLKKDSRK
jgi:hypothetical protein